MYRIDKTPGDRGPFSRPPGLAALEKVLSNRQIDTVSRQLGHTWRDRILPPSVTVRSMTYRALRPDKSIRGVLVDMAAADDRLQTAPAESSWCEARSRLPEGLLGALIEDAAEKTERFVGRFYRYAKRPVFIVDGSTLSMPDAPELVEAFGYADGKHGPSRFPVGRITFIVRAGVKGVRDYRFDDYRTGENTQLRQMWHRIPPGSICIFDKYLSSFYNLAKLRERGIDVVCPLHQRRDPAKLIAGGCRIGRNQWIVTLELARQSWKGYDDPWLPETLEVRLIRVLLAGKSKPDELWLVTTLLDHRRHRRRRVIRLYRDRWGIEGEIRSLKRTLQINVLRSKTLVGARYEVAATLLAYNLVWYLMHLAARKARVSAQRISFASAVKTVVAFSMRLRWADRLEREAIYDRMLRQIARYKNAYRPGRTEPRLVKRDPRRYGFLKIPRAQARQKCLS